MADQHTPFNLKEAIDFLLQSFKVERYIYLAVTMLSIILLGVLVVVLYKKQDFANILAMLGPTGLITFSCSRFLRMWSDCIDLVKTYISQKP